MRFLRVLVPFIFVRNWYTGQWEISRPRLIIFFAGIALFFLATLIIILLQAPVEYKTT